MRHSIQLAAAALCLALGVASSRAQVTNTLSLNLQNLNIRLTGSVGGGTNGGSASSFRLTTKDLIRAIGVSSNNAARLQFASTTLMTTNSTNQSVVFVVTSGNNQNTVATDVTPLFLVDTNSAFLVKGNAANQIMTFAFGVDTNGLPLTNSLGEALTPVTFVVQGFTTLQKNGGFNSQVNGSGTSGGNSTVLKGTISASPPSKTPVSVTVIR